MTLPESFVAAIVAFIVAVMMILLFIGIAYIIENTESLLIRFALGTILIIAFLTFGLYILTNI